MNYLMESAPGARTLINGRWRDYFSGTGYLGLQGHPDLIEAAHRGLIQYGLTSGTSRGGYGEHPAFHAVERAGAAFLGEERSLYTVSAYLGSNVLLHGLRGPYGPPQYERVYVDEAAHFSLRDAAGACGAPFQAFAHCDAAALSEALHKTLLPGERPLVLTDGVFPISGEIAPLRAYLDVLARYDGAILCVDDAHATGVIGTRGRGSLEFVAGTEAGRPQIGPVRCYTAHTLSKAMGGHGGLIGGSAQFVEQLWQNASALAGSSPAPIPAAAASAWALEYVGAHPALRQRLWVNVQRARAGFCGLGWALDETPIPIICLRARPGLDLARVQQELFARDLCVAHITRYSSTPTGGALRVAIFASHTDEQVERLVAEVGKLI